MATLHLNVTKRYNLSSYHSRSNDKKLISIEFISYSNILSSLDAEMQMLLI